MTNINKNTGFNSFVSEGLSLIPDIKKRIENNTDESRLVNLKWFLYTNLLEQTIAQYSAEYSKDEIAESLLDTITAFEEGFKWEGFDKSYAMYDQIIWLLSLGILCDISNQDIERIEKILKRDSVTDKLIATLVNYRLPGSIPGYAEAYIQKDPYSHLDMVVSGADTSAVVIKEYLDKKWYQGHSDAPWYNSHKNTKVNVFFGYWAWETAALVKIYNIDDSILKDQQYYPYRAVHWRGSVIL